MPLRELLYNQHREYCYIPGHRHFSKNPCPRHQHSGLVWFRDMPIEREGMPLDVIVIDDAERKDEVLVMHFSKFMTF